ncbi:hypothetical protein SAMN05421757_102134 [Tropicimonas sediminicola]|uniref:Uncharacterized protein n=1 Tax=Tropicimonas sediminicola TaxID=1031541 RepID=A0A239EG23_9RHOB|nr:hypothetical protein SAMN05421757_102134 [Tropicimonas sediminicola]
MPIGPQGRALYSLANRRDMSDHQVNRLLARGAGQRVFAAFAVTLPTRATGPNTRFRTGFPPARAVGFSVAGACHPFGDQAAAAFRQ